MQCNMTDEAYLGVADVLLGLELLLIRIAVINMGLWLQ